MISQKLLKEYEFETIENYFDYIVESHRNGQMKQCSELCKKLSSQQKRSCLQYIQEFYTKSNIDAVNFITNNLF